MTGMLVKRVGREPGLARRRAHPYLDPLLSENRPEIFRSFYRLYLSIRGDDHAYEVYLNRLLNPPGVRKDFSANLLTAAYYLNEAARYVDALHALFPRRRRAWLKPIREVVETQDMRALLAIVFGGSNPRRAFEAQRKLYLAKLFFDVEHTWEVQRGELHRRFFERLLEKQLHKYTVAQEDIDVAFNISANGVEIDYRIGSPLPNQEVWRFHTHELNFLQDGRPVRIHVHFYSCRSKREVLPYRYVRGQRVYRLETREKWTELSLRRDASIVSKMLRTGTSDPGQFPDIVGAMFIVEDILEVEILKQAIFDLVGGPMKIRNVVDTLTRSTDQEFLNPQSDAGYSVYKGDLDVLYWEEGSDAPPYGFVVELQLYTLEGYLRTIHTRHYASHHRLKRRQFLEGLAPLLFPDEIYGREARRANR